MTKSKIIIRSILILFCISIFGLYWSCQDDDEVCVDNGSSRLGIGFYTTNFEETKTLDSIIITRSDNTRYAFASVDSIFIPINLQNDSESLKIQLLTTGSDDLINLNYNRSTYYISKGCGFGVLYQNLTANLNTPANLLTQVKVTQTTIQDEKQVHLQLAF